MSDTDGAVIDPRYDPAFQRGFSGEVQTGAHGQSTLRRTAAVNPAPSRGSARRVEEFPSDSTQAQAEAPTVTTDAVSSTAHPDAPTTTLSLTDPAAAAQQSVPLGGTTPRELARNPFVIALAALAAVLILAGVVWAYEGFATIVKNGGTRNEVEFWAAQTMSFGAPLAIVAGLAIGAVLLVLFGRTWQRSRTREIPE